MLPRHPDILVEIECRDIAEAAVLALTLVDDPLVHAEGRAAGGEGEDCFGVLVDGG
jgi:hypothetical protein